MTQFPGQISNLSLNGTQGIVWAQAPFYLKVFFKVKELSSAIFPVTTA